MASFVLKDSMKLGVATAATQIEGGDTDHNWNDWYKKGRIRDGSDPARADDHYIRFREDTALMASMGMQVYRFGIEWSRIEPENGVFSSEALAHYREELILLKKYDILPLLTFHHFNNPMWLERLGGFENPDIEVIFLRFVNKVVHALGDLVAEYVTINEPNVYATNSFFIGDWPPGKKSFSSVIRVYRNCVKCHTGAYEMIHKIRREMGFTDTKVGIAMHLRVFEPKNRWNPWHLICNALLKQFFQDAITREMSIGKASFPIGRIKGVRPGKYYDFLGVNYYSRSTVSGFGDGVRAHCPVTDLGWEIYPKGILECSKKIFDKYKAPVYITENGTCDNQDRFRSRYIFEHLKALCDSDLPVERYYHWSLLDNFEWTEGESARFGLVHVDYETQKRMVKKSGEFYSRIIRERGVSEALYEEYCKQEYPMK